MERIHLLLVISTVVIFVTVIFTALLVAAGTLQMHSAAAGIDLAMGADSPLNYMIFYKLYTSMAGPPLSWAVALLNMVNPNWWLNNYMAWALIEAFMP